jgi:hypothetical protein
MDQILENLLLSNIKGSYMIKIKKILVYLEKNFSFRVVLRLRGVIVAPPIPNGPIKKKFPQILLFMHN